MRVPRFAGQLILEQSVKGDRGFEHEQNYRAALRAAFNPHKPELDTMPCDIVIGSVQQYYDDMHQRDFVTIKFPDGSSVGLYRPLQHQGLKGFLMTLLGRNPFIPVPKLAELVMKKAREATAVYKRYNGNTQAS